MGHNPFLPRRSQRRPCGLAPCVFGICPSFVGTSAKCLVFLAPQDVPGSSLLPRPCKVSWSLPSRNSGWKPRSVGHVQVTARSVCSLIPYFDTVQHQAFRSHILVHVCAHAHTHTHILVKDSQGAGHLLPYPTPLDLGPGTSSVQPTCPDRFSPPPTRYPGDPGSRLLSLPALLIAILLITAATCY